MTFGEADCQTAEVQPTVERSLTADPKQMQKQVQALSKAWSRVLQSQDEWNFNAHRQALQAFQKHLQQVCQAWDSHQHDWENALAIAEATIQTSAYASELEQALTQAKIPWEGSFPEYTFHPFQLKFNLEAKITSLKFGRKQFGKNLQMFAIPKLVAYLSQQYQNVFGSRFQRDRFCKDLLSAYRIAVHSAAIYSSKDEEEVPLGKMIRLEVLYRLLTLRQETRSEYSRALFQFDLARLLEEPYIAYDKYVFEFSPSKKAAENWRLCNRKGHERQVANLTISLRNNQNG
jgi:hypothetical protein